MTGVPAEPPLAADLAARVRQSLGASADPIYEMVADVLDGRHPGGGTLLDVGCGTGNLWRHVRDRFARYVGVDVVRHDGFPAGAEFHRADLNADRVPLPDETADVVTAVEMIEHLENPRGFSRELTRLCRAGGWVVITTPNQLSLLSKLTLLVRNEFNAFRASTYPAHLTALLEVDLRRIAAECGLAEVAVRYTGSGRVPGTAARYPRWASRRFPRALSDNVLLVARKPGGVAPVSPVGGDGGGLR